MCLRWKLLPILALLISLAAAGCSAPRFIRERSTPEAYVGPDKVAEIREPAEVLVWVRDQKTGEMKRAKVRVWQGWLVGPSAPSHPELK